jgi:CubicO group peptidase (beta-lactamase class C family)
MNRTPKITLMVAAVTGPAVALLGLLVAPDPHRLGTARAGDPALAQRVVSVIDGNTAGYQGLSVALIEGGRTSTAVVGDTGGGPLFEIGSVAKTFTGMLLASLVADGTVRADEPLRALLPDVRFTDPAVGDVTLQELAAHTSGLPRVAPGSLGSTVESLVANLRGANPYGGADVEAVVAAAGRATVGDSRGTIDYSNFGMALLGQALANRAGTPYPQLVTERVLRPLGLPDWRTGGLADCPADTGLFSRPIRWTALRDRRSRPTRPGVPRACRPVAPTHRPPPGPAAGTSPPVHLRAAG